MLLRPVRVAQNNRIGSNQIVTPANPGSESGAGAGVQKISNPAVAGLGSGLRRNDGKKLRQAGWLYE